MDLIQGWNIGKDNLQRFINRIVAPLLKLRWKLTLSYTIVTVAALLVVEIVLILGLSRHILERSRTTPEELLEDLNMFYVPNVRHFLSEIPPDIAGLRSSLASRSVPAMDFEPIRIGDFVFDVSNTNMLKIIYISEDGTLIDSLPHRFIKETEIGEKFNATEFAGLEGPLRAAFAGETNLAHLTKQMPEDIIVGALPIRNKYDDTWVVGALAFEHKSQFWQVVDKANLISQIGISLFFITVFVGIFGSIFGSLTARGLVQRLRRLIVTATYWSRGDFSAYIEDPVSDEIGDLANSLNRMATQLEELLEERQTISVIEERNRLARDLHDSVKQQAFAASAQLAASQARFLSNPDDSLIHLDEAERLLYEVRLELADLINELRPVALQGKGLAAALYQYVSDCSSQSDININVYIHDERKLPFDIEQTLFRIVQGAISNIMRHSQATQAVVSLSFDAHTVTLVVTDNGRGFDTSEDQNGLGLRLIQERAKMLKGNLIIRSEPGKGTEISLRFGYRGKPDIIRTRIPI